MQCLQLRLGILQPSLQPLSLTHAAALFPAQPSKLQVLYAGDDISHRRSSQSRRGRF